MCDCRFLMSGRAKRLMRVSRPLSVCCRGCQVLGVLVFAMGGGLVALLYIRHYATKLVVYKHEAVKMRNASPPRSPIHFPLSPHRCSHRPLFAVLFLCAHGNCWLRSALPRSLWFALDSCVSRASYQGVRV